MAVRSGSVSMLLMLATTVLSHGAGAQASATSKPPVQAIWMPHEVTFYFQSFTTFYTCNSLDAKIRRILLAVGADEGLKVRTRGCFSGNGIARSPQVDIVMVSAVEATPEALAERDKTRSTRELVARVRGQTEELQQVEEQFPAQWREVALSRGRLYLDPGDCELVDQLKDKVFPQLGIRIVEDDVKCSPNQVSITQPRLVVEALFPMPKPDEASGEKEP